MTEIHNEGCECGFCRWANSTTAISSPDFDHTWDNASPSRTRYTERDEARYWFQRGVWAGIQYERERGLVAIGQDLREMQRLARVRVS